MAVVLECNPVRKDPHVRPLVVAAGRRSMNNGAVFVFPIFLLHNWAGFEIIYPCRHVKGVLDGI